MRFMFHELVEERNRERCITVTVGSLDQTLVAVAIFTVLVGNAARCSRRPT
jgi:hypothetical protein